MRRPAVVLALAGIGLCGSRAGAAPAGVEWKELSRTATPEPVLALAFVGSGRLLVLSPRSVSLWSLDGAEARRQARLSLPDAALPVRHAGGLILGHIDDSAAWLLSSHAPRARLVRIDGRRLLLDAEADAVPWPDAAQGLRFRMGTNLLEGLEVAGARPALVAVDAASRAAVVEDGALLVDSAPTGTRVGGAVATLWPGMLIASAADPPSSEDSLLVLSRVGGAWRVAPGIRVGGAVRALAAHADGAATGRVAVAVAAAGRFELLHFEARRRP